MLRLVQGLRPAAEVHALFSWLPKRVFPPEEAKVSAEQAAQHTRYVDEKHAKAIKRAALFAEPRGAMGTSQCPRCGAEMALELARRGNHAGSKLWGMHRVSKLPSHAKGIVAEPLGYWRSFSMGHSCASSHSPSDQVHSAFPRWHLGYLPSPLSIGLG